MDFVCPCGGAGRLLFLYLEGGRAVCNLVLADGRARRVHGLSSLADARQLYDLQARSLAVCVAGEFVGRGIGHYLGIDASQASRP